MTHTFRSEWSELIGQADGVDVVLKDKVVLKVEEGKVILEVPLVVSWMDRHSCGIPVLVLQGLNDLPRVPFATSDCQFFRLIDKITANLNMDQLVVVV